MIQVNSKLHVVDNSGARIIQCINVPKKAARLGGFPGDIIKSSIKRTLSRFDLKKIRLMKKGQLATALIVRTIFGFKRWSGFYYRANSNSVVLVNKYFMPVGTRLFGPVFREIRGRKFFRILAKAEVVL